jgi:hypothetical protein
MTNSEDIIKKVSEIERLTKELKTLEKKTKVDKQQLIDEMTNFLLPLGFIKTKNRGFERNGLIIDPSSLFGSNTVKFLLYEPGMYGLCSATWKFKRESFETFYKKIIKV